MIAFLLGLVYALSRGTLPESFREAPDPHDRPTWLTWSYNEDTWILRQSGLSNYEKPFLYLFFGTEKALLIDSGANNGHPRSIIEEIYGEHEGRSGERLIVAHTHSHGDHIAGDADLSTLPYVDVIATDINTIEQSFNLTWPNIGAIDLGYRVIDVIPIPGHYKDSTAFYDRATGLLITGDSIYPGRLTIPAGQLNTYISSHERLRAFAKVHEVKWVLGGHIEQSEIPYEDYPVGTIYQPDEHVLQFNATILDHISDSLKHIDKPGVYRYPEYSIDLEGTKLLL